MEKLASEGLLQTPQKAAPPKQRESQLERHQDDLRRSREADELHLKKRKTPNDSSVVLENTFMTGKKTTSPSKTNLKSNTINVGQLDRMNT